MHAPSPHTSCAHPHRDKLCPKNHIKHTTMELIIPETEELEQTLQSQLELKHHKNSGRRGLDVVPMAQAMVEPLNQLEQAARVLAKSSNCPTLFFSKGPPPAPYSEGYFSQVATGLLSTPRQHTTANALRHMFSTQFRNFRSSQVARQEQLEVELEEAAAALMGNSPPAWDATYDDAAQLRKKLKVLEEYPKFKEWVKAQAALHKQVKPRNPHEG